MPNPPPRVTPKRRSTYTSRHKSLCAQHGTKHDDHAYKKRRLNPDHDSVGVDIASTSADVDDGSTASCIPSVRAWNTKRKTNGKIQVLRKKLFAVQQKLKILEENLKRLLNDDQLNALKTPTRRVPCWSEATIKKALQIRFAAGPTGYNLLRQQGMPLPASRTLSERLRHVTCRPGVQHDIIDALKEKSAIFSAYDHNVILAIDEIQLKAQIEYDASLKELTGYTTLPKTGKAATHALVAMIRGIATYWKQVVSWHLTANSVPGAILHSHVIDIIRCVEETGFKVRGIVTDMGPTNTSLWRHLGVKVSRDQRIHYAQHPVRTESKLYIFADPQHVLKNIRNCLLKYDIQVSVCTDDEQQVTDNDVPEAEEFVECVTNGEAYQSDNSILSSEISISARLDNIVSALATVQMQHFHSLLLKQEQYDLRLAPKLSQKHLNPDQHKKMNVRLAYELLHEDTAAALKTMAKLQMLGNDVNVTAWFCELISRWFRIVSSRRKKDGLVKSWEADYADKVQFLQQTIDVFTTMTAGPRWMPFQSGLMMTTLSIMALSHELMEEGFAFVLCGRFSQDALESLFSVIRSRGDRYPSALRFRANLRNISVSQYLTDVKSSSYIADQDEYFVDLLKPRIRNRKQTDLPAAMDSSTATVPFENDEAEKPTATVPSEHAGKNVVRPAQVPLDPADDMMLQNTQFSLSGYVVRTLLPHLCNECKLDIACHALGESVPETTSTFYFRKLNRGGMTAPTNKATQILTAAEKMFQSIKNDLQRMEDPINQLTTQFLKTCDPVYATKLRFCCNLFHLLIKRYFTVRIHQFGEAQSRSLAHRPLNK